ncbi:MAG: tRNA preQ1(34) S-adenosylmethionine ribosyltransferase-isomerase QueA [Chlamydiia bacterium]|nr:tRNA preQ1(34) S-adenosylmethionine ribosyltransferase-isomerase QueA [Chlamydiia bacterium]
MNEHLYRSEAYAFDLPEALIAQHPVSPRDASRLMIVERETGVIHHVQMRDLPHWLDSGDLLLFNNARVIPARLFGTRESGGHCELLYLERVGETRWRALARPYRKCCEGKILQFGTHTCRVEAQLGEGRIELSMVEGELDGLLRDQGTMPLPPYIRKGRGEERDEVDYQTIYAQTPTAFAAPTAGLHFTEQLMEALRQRGLDRAFITLDVGLGTFRPIRSEDIRDHVMHPETYRLGEADAEKLNRVAKDSRLICVGTTSLRAIESISLLCGPELEAGEHTTSIFIYPGFRFQRADALLTNFHLPRSSLLLLISAFGGYELIMEAYRQAIALEYRFYSYGDAMLII